MNTAEDRSVLFWGKISLLAGLIILALKFWAYFLTKSQAIFSDALESVVNVIAAAFALGMLRYAAKPADENHPYGHGKSEFFSAAFEGGLISFASVIIFIESLSALYTGKQVAELSTGMLLIVGAGLLNLLLGLCLLVYGRKHHSAALVASGHHIASDFWTSLAAFVGLYLIHVTGKHWIDGVIGLCVGGYLAFTGLKILRRSVAGLLDEEDRKVLQAFAEALNKVVRPGVIGVHRTRVMQAGRYHYIDAHVVVPEFWDVTHAHDESNQFERLVIEKYRFGGEIHFHIDPCRRKYCKNCDLVNCAVRQGAFEARLDYNVDRVVNIAPLKE